MWLLMILALSFVGNSVYGQDDLETSSTLKWERQIQVNDGGLRINIPQMVLGPVGGNGSGGPSYFTARCVDGFNTMLETLSGFGLGVFASLNQKEYMRQSYRYANNKLKFDFQTTDRAFDVCERSPQVCGIVSSITPRGDQFVAGMVATQGSNSFMSPFGGASYGISQESMMRSMAYQNPFMFGGYGGYNNQYGGYNNQYGGYNNNYGGNYGRGTIG